MDTSEPRLELRGWILAPVKSMGILLLISMEPGFHLWTPGVGFAEALSVGLALLPLKPMRALPLALMLHRSMKWQQPSTVNVGHSQLKAALDGIGQGPGLNKLKYKSWSGAEMRFLIAKDVLSSSCCVTTNTTSHQFVSHIDYC